MGILSYIKKHLSGQEENQNSSEQSIENNIDSENSNDISLEITSTIEPVSEERKVYEENFLEIKERAENGEALFMTDLGLCYSQGWGVPKDKNKALYWTQKAAELKDPMGIHNLGVYYRDELNPPDFEKARDCFLESSELGLSRSSNDLGTMYYNGNGVEKNFETAAKWYKKAIEQENPFHLAFKNLAAMYKHGQGVGQDTDESIRLLFEGAKLGSPLCKYFLSQELFDIYVLGITYYYGLDNIIDKAKGKSLIETASKYEYNPALLWRYANSQSIQNNKLFIDVLYRDVLGLDYIEYVKMRVNNLSTFDEIETTKGASRGEIDEMCYLALMALFMDSEHYKNENAIELLTKSAQGGYTMAVFWLAYCYEKGLGIEKDINTAKALYYEVIKRGSSEAMWVNGMGVSLHPGLSDIDRGLAESHYRLASIAYYEENYDATVALLSVDYGNCKHHIPSIFLYAKMYQVRGETEKALEGFRYCEAYKSAEAAYELAVFYLNNNDLKQFEIHCMNAIECGSIKAVSLWLENKK